MNDRPLSHEEVQRLTSREAIVAFFAALGYDTEKRIEQTPANLGITAESTTRDIRRIELVASQPPRGMLQVYLFEVRSVTVALTRALCRNLVRKRTNNFLLVLTSDYERIDFVLAERYSPEPPAGGRLPRQPRLGVRGLHLMFESIKQLRFHDAMRLIEAAGRHKLNTILMEFGDRFPFEAPHDVISSPGALTRGEVRQLVRRATEMGITVIPLLQSQIT